MPASAGAVYGKDGSDSNGAGRADDHFRRKAITPTVPIADRRDRQVPSFGDAVVMGWLAASLTPCSASAVGLYLLVSGCWS